MCNENMKDEVLEQEPVQEEKIDVVKGIEMLETQLIKTQEELEQAKKEIDINKEVFQRTLAEYDNFRKRSAKEKSESYNNGLSNTVNNILPIIDTLEMALSAPCSDENYKKGIEMTMSVAKASLEKLGVKEIEAIEKEFDPNLHAAVMQEQIDGIPAGMVTKQLQKGYMLGDKIIRHATVAVSC